jgi:dienelactone hydrolase
MLVAPCCHAGFEWDGIPTGHIDTLGKTNTYVTGDNPDKAILLIHDLFSWTFTNVCLLADHYAREADATVFVPDFMSGKVLPFASIPSGNIHEHRIFEFAKVLRTRFRRLGAVGFCFGGWAVFRLAAKEHQPPLVDCITAGHPTLVTEKDIDDIAVPVQILAPEYDAFYTEELKTHSLEMIQKVGLPFDFQHFPEVEHACFIRGDPRKAGEWEAGERAKKSAVSWLRKFLDD